MTDEAGAQYAPRPTCVRRVDAMRDGTARSKPRSPAIIFTSIFTNTGGSVLMCALCHGCSNLGMILYYGIDPAFAPWFKCSTSVLMTLGVMAWAGPRSDAGAGCHKGEPSHNGMKLTAAPSATASRRHRWIPCVELNRYSVDV